MRGLVFFLEAFYALLGVAFLATLQLPPTPSFENLIALQKAFWLSRSLEDGAFKNPAAIEPLEGYCIRVTSQSVSHASCEAKRWVGVPRTVYDGESFELYKIDVGEKA